MTDLNRRNFLKTGIALVAGVAAGSSSVLRAASPERKMTIDLVCGALGIRASQVEAVDLAQRHGFESVAPDVGYLRSLTDDALKEFLADLRAKGLVWGAAGLPVEFRQDEQIFEAGMKDLPDACRALQRAGVTRVGTWLMPMHAELTFMKNLKRHARRLRAAVRIMNDHGLRFGMEYVGTKTLWASQRFPFVHTMTETKELIAEIGEPHVGFVLDSWHWSMAEETDADLLSLTNSDVIAVDLNDAPRGIPIDEQIDSNRELPAATGVLATATFVNALAKIGYDGPVRAEPFNQTLRELPADDAAAATAKAIRKAFAMIR
jgi:sugar phosphate isomerase/epimerase